MRGPRNRALLASLWLGLVLSPVSVGVALGLVPAGTFRPLLSPDLLQWIVLAGVALGASSLAVLKRFRALEAGGDELALRQALLIGAGAADLSMILGVVYFSLGGERPVFWAMCAASAIFIALFRPRT